MKNGTTLPARPQQLKLGAIALRPIDKFLPTERFVMSLELGISIRAKLPEEGGELLALILMRFQVETNYPGPSR